MILDQIAAALDLLASLAAGTLSIVQNFVNIVFGWLVYYFLFFPLKTLVSAFFDILLNSVIISPVPRDADGNLAIFGPVESFEGDANSEMLSETAEIATGYMEPIGFLIIFIGIGLVLFFRIFDVVINTDFDSETAQKRLLIAPILILLWIPIANIILAVASGITDLFLSIDVSVSSSLTGEGIGTGEDLDYSALLNSFGPTDAEGNFDLTATKVPAIIIGSLFLGASFLVFLVTLLAAFIRLFALYLLYAIGPLAIAMWAFAWKKISELGSSYIRYFVLLAIFPAPAALISKLAPIFIVTLETVVVGNITGGETTTSGTGTVVNSDLYDTIGLNRVVRAFGLLIVPLAVGFGPWVFVIGLGNAMTLAAGTAAVGTLAATGGGALVASGGLSAAKKGASKAGVKGKAANLAGKAKEKAPDGATKAGGVAKRGASTVANSRVGRGVASVGGTVRDYGGVAYDHRKEIADKVANSKMLASTGGFGRMVQGGAGILSSEMGMREDAKDIVGKGREEAKQKRDKRSTRLESYFGSNEDTDTGLLDPDESDSSVIGNRGMELERQYAANNFSDEQLKKHMAASDNFAVNDWQNVDDDMLEQNRQEAFLGFANHVEQRADDVGKSPEEFMRDTYGDRVAEDFADSINPEFSELRDFGIHKQGIDRTEFQEGGRYSALREEYDKEGNRGYYASRAQAEGFATYGVDEDLVNDARADVQNSLDDTGIGDSVKSRQGLDELLERYIEAGDKNSFESALNDLDNGDIDGFDMSGIDEDTIAQAVHEAANDYGYSEKTDIEAYLNGESGEVKTASTPEQVNRERTDRAVTPDGINPDVDSSVQQDMSETLETVIKESAEDALVQSSEAVTADDIETGKADFDMGKMVNEFMKGIEGVDSISDLDSTDRKEAEQFIQDYMQGHISTVTESVTKNANVEKMVEQTSGKLQSGQMEKSIKNMLSKTTAQAVNNGLDFDDMDIETREELIDVQVADSIADNIEDVAHEYQNQLMDEVGKSVEDMNKQDVVVGMRNNRELRDDLMDEIEVE